ncbi:unnamed protein product [Cuscuta epithymum]|uniref:Uncharacterized protein n=1 Tax=Cuscuta epithymum TaxID=186058 RepID=A0AAV0EJT3_9ASTE|nr:unnamed protein product [Cuscuta epithymum]
MMHKISFRLDRCPKIIQFISQISDANCNQRKKNWSYHDLLRNQQSWQLLAKEKGSFILIPMGPQKSNMFKFITILSNFAGFQKSMQDDSISFQHWSTFETEDPTSISKLIFNFQIEAASTEKQLIYSLEKQPKLTPIQAYSDASDSFDYSDDSFSDDYLGHATESERRPPISNQEEIRNTKFNRAICQKANFVTTENYIPTENLNMQLKIYMKSQKNKRRHSMTTRSQSRDFSWD